MTAPKRDAGEQHFRIPSHHAGLSLFLRYLPPHAAGETTATPVLYVHGGTFPSALSIAHRFDGHSWRDALAQAGFPVWGLDFHGFGRLSDPYPEMAAPDDANAPLGRTDDASRQLEQAVRFICAHHGVKRVALVAHSWGTMVAGHFAGRCSELVARMVFFGPIAWRAGNGDAIRLPAWRLISAEDQWRRFVADVPAGENAVLSRRHFDDWAMRYLAVDPDSATRNPPSVKVPSGAFQDIFDAWDGRLSYDPARVRCPVAIIRGEWDSLCTDADAAWLFTALRHAAERRDIKISRATHLMHLEESRFALYRETEAFLRA